MDEDHGSLWAGAGVVLAFQLGMLLLRVVRDLDFRGRKVLRWFPPADLLNLASILITLLGVFLAPLLGIGSDTLPEEAFGLALLLLAGYPFALGSHYVVTDSLATPSESHVPWLEKLVLAIVGILAGIYVTLTVIR